jgi:hypothetical protein
MHGGRRKRRQVRVGAPDPSLTPNAGMAAVSALCERLGVIGVLDAALGPVKQRDRGYDAGELLTGIAGGTASLGVSRRLGDTGLRYEEVPCL